MSRAVFVELLRIYRVQAVVAYSMLVVSVIIVDALLIQGGEQLPFSVWALSSWAPRYWLAAIGVMIASVHVRQFVTAGVTRRAYLIGAAGFGVAAALLFALVTLVGHVVEQALTNPVAFAYPAFEGFNEYVGLLGGLLAYLVIGFAVSATFYRFGVWAAVLAAALVVPLLLVLESGPVPLMPGLSVWLVLLVLLTGLLAFGAYALLRQAPIKPVAG